MSITFADGDIHFENSTIAVDTKPASIITRDCESSLIINSDDCCTRCRGRGIGNGIIISKRTKETKINRHTTILIVNPECESSWLSNCCSPPRISDNSYTRGLLHQLELSLVRMRVNVFPYIQIGLFVIFVEYHWLHPNHHVEWHPRVEWVKWRDHRVEWPVYCLI
jgi:hypothetical protein